MRMEGRTFVYYAVSVLVLVFILFPILLMVVGGFMPETELRSNPGERLWFVHGPTTAYYQYILLSPFGFGFPSNDPYVTEAGFPFLSILNVQYFLPSLLNSVVVAAAVAVLNLLLASLAAFAFTRTNFRGRTGLFIFVLVSRLLPPVVLAIPYFILIQSLGLLNNLGAVILIDTVLTLPFSIWYLVLYLRTIPVEMEEASLVDGASLMQTFWHITLRISGSGLLAITLFSFLLSYNEFLFARFLLGRPEFTTVPVYVGSLATSLVVYWAIIHAVLALTILPMAVLVLFFKKYINITELAGAIKR